jgi:hypothetical protein
MIRTKGRYRKQNVELDYPLDLADGTEVELVIYLTDEREGWMELGLSRLEEDWSNPQDSIYDDWKKLYS